ncbi:hypothetical protein CmeUKMEL1_07360 [Cryptosporidium meleagridis]|uniref:Uncharacterized protein n=1 Tax=Cryptosporidium meleagridis TaxID=93969 RepID=A0A2P4Z0B2_9CRYT|nr:hypothetical protein CmeUKMEL1_07360 [Cryptosporidium meleagridis]
MSNQKNKFVLQIDTHWGDPLYVTCKNSSEFILNFETWKYAKSRSKSIGILLEMSDSNGLNKYPFCLTILSSGKLMNNLSNSRIFLDKFIKLLISSPMFNELNKLPLDYGQIVFFDELLFLVERGSLLLFSWSQARLEWVQTPILYLFDVFIKNEELFKLNNYISYSRMKRSGYKFKSTSNENKFRIQGNIQPDIKFLKCIDEAEYLQYDIPIKQKIALSSINSNLESYLITNLERKPKNREKNGLFFTSKQPHDTFLIGNNITRSNNNFVVSIISINSETRLKASIYKF